MKQNTLLHSTNSSLRSCMLAGLNVTHQFHSSEECAHSRILNCADKMTQILYLYPNMGVVQSDHAVPLKSDHYLLKLTTTIVIKIRDDYDLMAQLF